MNNGIEWMNDNDRLNGSIQSLSNLKKEVTPLGITPSEIVSAIDNAWIRYDWDRILTRGRNITIWGVTYKKLTGPNQKGPVYQISRDNGGHDYITLRDRYIDEIVKMVVDVEERDMSLNLVPELCMIELLMIAPSIEP